MKAATLLAVPTAGQRHPGRPPRAVTVDVTLGDSLPGNSIHPLACLTAAQRTEERRHALAQVKEQSDLRQRLQALSAESAPLAAAMARAREFVAGWATVAQILDAAEEDELRLLLQHFVEVIELAHESADGKTGTYALRLFPEVRPLDPPHGPENEGGPPDPTSGGRPALTEAVETCGDQQKAPRVGLEPTTNRLRLPPCFHGERTISSPQRGAGRSRLGYWMGSSPASLCTFPATDCPSPGLAQDCRHPKCCGFPARPTVSIP